MRKRRWPASFLFLTILFGLIFWVVPREQSLTDPRLRHVKAPDDRTTITYYWDDAGNLYWFHMNGVWRFDAALTLKQDLRVAKTNIEGFDYVSGMGWHWGTPFSRQKRALEVMADLSPRGDKLLWLERANPDYRWRMSAVGAKEVSEWACPVSLNAGPAVWLNDDVHWAAVCTSDAGVSEILIGDSRAPGAPARHPLPKELSSLEAPLYLFGRAGPDQIALHTGSEPDLTTCDVALLDMRHGAAIAERHRLHASMAVTADLADINPRTRRLAWIVERDASSSFWQKLVGRIFHRSETAAEELWVCEFDGSGWRKIGYLENSTNDRQIRDVKWLSDGQRLSFLVGDTIWIVPAE